MNKLIEDEDADDGLLTGWGNSPVAFLMKIFALSSVVALLAWWFVLS